MCLTTDLRKWAWVYVSRRSGRGWREVQFVYQPPLELPPRQGRVQPFPGRCPEVLERPPHVVAHVLEVQRRRVDVDTSVVWEVDERHNADQVTVPATTEPVAGRVVPFRYWLPSSLSQQSPVYRRWAGRPGSERELPETEDQRTEEGFFRGFDSRPSRHLGGVWGTLEPV